MKHLTEPIPIHGVVLAQLQADGLYERPVEHIAGRMFDVRSRRADYNGAMSTEFAISRFFVPRLAGSGWALFMDCDMLVRRDLAELFALADPSKAVMCVQHDYAPTQNVKMDGQPQTAYSRKNWSSLMLFNCDHPANMRLSLKMLNGLPGIELHNFCWLSGPEIGVLPAEWNYLVGEGQECSNPAIVHFTNGCPPMKGYENVEYSDEWRAAC